MKKIIVLLVLVFVLTEVAIASNFKVTCYVQEENGHIRLATPNDEVYTVQIMCANVPITESNVNLFCITPLLPWSGSPGPADYKKIIANATITCTRGIEARIKTESITEIRHDQWVGRDPEGRREEFEFSIYSSFRVISCKEYLNGKFIGDIIIAPQHWAVEKRTKLATAWGKIKDERG